MHIISGCKDTITPITKKPTHLFLNYITFYEFMINFLLKNVREWTLRNRNLIRKVGLAENWEGPAWILEG